MFSAKGSASTASEVGRARVVGLVRVGMTDDMLCLFRRLLTGEEGWREKSKYIGDYGRGED